MNTENKKTIYDLELHETIEVEHNLEVQKVASGWNYIYKKEIFEGGYGFKEIEQVVFVPFDNNLEAEKD